MEIFIRITYLIIRIINIPSPSMTHSTVKMICLPISISMVLTLNESKEEEKDVFQKHPLLFPC
jgi:hypothetical protein